MNRRTFISMTALAAAGLPACSRKPRSPDSAIRIGHFPNITHVQALVAYQLSREGKGWYESRLGVPVEWYTYNAGPSATEAIIAGALDVTYIGPSPVLSTYVRSAGQEIRVLAGAANGGSSIVVRKGSGIETLDDFRGKRVAVPQPGNTQDVQLRAMLREHGYRITQSGGDVSILEIANGDLLQLFLGEHLDAAWAPEPFASLLELQAGAVNFLEDTDTNVTMLASSVAFLRDRPELARKLVEAHRELTDWIKAHPQEARELVVAALTELTTRAPNPEVVDRALSRVVITNELSRPSLQNMLDNAVTAGFLKDPPPLDALLSHLPEDPT